MHVPRNIPVMSVIYPFRKSFKAQPFNLQCFSVNLMTLFTHVMTHLLSIISKICCFLNIFAYVVERDPKVNHRIAHTEKQFENLWINSIFTICRYQRILLSCNRVLLIIRIPIFFCSTRYNGASFQCR